MPISAIYILDLLCKPLIIRDYRGNHDPEVGQKFLSLILEGEVDKPLTPVLEHNGTTFVFIKHNNVYVVSPVSNNANVSMVLVFLYKFIDIMNKYFKEVEEESIRDNFVLINELLDEVLDFGYPQITESNILMEYITQESKKLERPKKIPPAVTNAVSWRSEGIKYKKNELFLDIVESIYLVSDCYGMVVRSEVIGAIRIKTCLSGMPEIHLGLNDKFHYEDGTLCCETKQYVVLDEVKFHQCVRLYRFEKDHNISFIPPDGEFELMTYRVNTYVKPPIYVDCTSKYYPNRKVEYTIKLTTRFKSELIASQVIVIVPVPSDVDSPVLKTSTGKIEYDPEDNVMEWTIKSLPGCKECLATASFRLPSVVNEDQEPMPPIQVRFNINHFTTSGMRVQFLKVIEKSGYSATPWVRYCTRQGDYQIRQKEVYMGKE